MIIMTFLIMIMIRRSIGRLSKPPSRPYGPRLLHACQTGETMIINDDEEEEEWDDDDEEEQNEKPQYSLLLKDMYGPAAVYSYEPTPSPG